jgi:hypothetical protein
MFFFSVYSIYVVLEVDETVINIIWVKKYRSAFWLMSYGFAIPCNFYVCPALRQTFSLSEETLQCASY